MGIRDILKRIVSKDKKIVITGLDNAGKTTMVSFLQTGTFIEHTPTMGKEQVTLEVQGVRIDLVDMGGQRDFRSMWQGELDDAQFAIFMVDAADRARFKEAKTELNKISSLLQKIPLMVLANKYDKKDVASIKEIIEALGLQELSSFEIVPISCKTGYNIVKAFRKIYYKLTGSQLKKRLQPKALTIFDKGGVPLTSTSSEDVLKGGLFAAITSFIKESFKSELSQLKLEGNTIIFKKSKNFMGSIVIDDSEYKNLDEAEQGLDELLCHLENMCPEAEEDKIDEEKLKFLVEQYSTNLIE
ncbi:MAG: GTP-binding protein [Candidatus Lokiarchaeota archaeon]|nr:GTP-binding protein [Candidatus Lokiarchaeota archaeon]MBD3199826.1 GTP-binding protein [Candidatus Lokiarchaeota archaeon]